MNESAAIEVADAFLRDFDPEGTYDPAQTRLIAMAILYGEKRGLLEMHDLAVEAIRA